MRGTCLVTGVAAAVVLAVGLSLSTPLAVLGQDGAPPPRNADEFDEMFKRLSNWGRWGEDDERGTLNLITPEKRRQAAALVKEGITVSRVSRTWSRARRSTWRTSRPGSSGLA